jgi:hypothetical protein
MIYSNKLNKQEFHIGRISEKNMKENYPLLGKMCKLKMNNLGQLRIRLYGKFSNAHVFLSNLLKISLFSNCWNQGNKNRIKYNR